ncbi:MAG: nitrate reductase cytochrome c-type subunit [Candidatus Hydrogenedentes bacterium]|nr:nitrate reductase cytochrome c-type subunit [Candidatus Hydrogenedentota bacterium]
MSAKPASPLTGALILLGFVALALAVLFGVRAKLHSTVESHMEHGASWAEHSVEPLAVETVAAPPPRTVSNPRPGAKVRTLREYYSRRAYAGAPPIIPHAVENDGVISDACLTCHKDGGYVPEYNAYTPVTPHPEMANCRQCHVVQVTEGLFAETEWVQPALPKRGRQTIPGGPLQIPHPLQFRENCLACHTGPQAVVEIRSSHPERENCLQCHVVDRAVPPFKSKIDPRMELADAEK